MLLGLALVQGPAEAAQGLQVLQVLVGCQRLLLWPPQPATGWQAAAPAARRLTSGQRPPAPRMGQGWLLARPCLPCASCCRCCWQAVEPAAAPAAAAPAPAAAAAAVAATRAEHLLLVVSLRGAVPWTQQEGVLLGSLRVA